MEEFRAKIKQINGRKILSITPRVEKIQREHGIQDVIVHAPSLKIVNSFMKKHNLDGYEVEKKQGGK